MVIINNGSALFVQKTILVTMMTAKGIDIQFKMAGMGFEQLQSSERTERTPGPSERLTFSYCFIQKLIFTFQRLIPLKKLHKTCFATQVTCVHLLFPLLATGARGAERAVRIWNVQVRGIVDCMEFDTSDTCVKYFLGLGKIFKN